jgi:hypothetical protein
MKYGKMWCVAVLIAMVGAAGCASSTTSAKPKAGTTNAGKKADHAAHGAGPNGGVVFDLGKYHAEFTVNHDKKECTILVLGNDEKTPKPVAAKELTLTTKETKTNDGKVVAPMTIKMLPQDEKDGKATKFVGTDPGLGNVADFEGSVAAEIDGKPASGEFKEG